MSLKLNIIDAAMRLMNLLEHCDDLEFINIVCEAVSTCNIGMLLDLEEAFEE